jgi:Protein of unknown function DUF2617
MGVSHGRTRVSELVFQVFSRSVHPDWFAVKAHRRIVQEGWEADLRVIDGGHAVSFRSGKVRLTEVLTGPENPLPEPGLLFHSTIRHERSVTLRPGPAIEYQSCFEVERVDPEVFAHLSDELALDAAPARLFHRFAPQNRLAPAPLSLLRFEARVRGLTVHAFHTFPEERAIVRTQSLFEPK